MSRSVSPGSFRGHEGPWQRRQPLFVVDLVRRFGVKAVLVIVVAALFAFAPLTLLYWFNELSRQAVTIIESGQRVVVKPGRHKQEQERDEPGDTALLQVVCDVPGSSGYRELLCDEDPARGDARLTDSTYVRRELAYVRRAGQPQLPFGLLGKPPVSAWLPTGDYEILVVHEASRREFDFNDREYSFPWVSVVADCSLEARRKTICRVPLPHYGWGGATAIELPVGEGPADARGSLAAELAPLRDACARIHAIPTPSGYLLALDEPSIRHTPDHQHCLANPGELRAVPREWTRDQLAALRNWLPAEAVPARAKLSQLIDRLQWREFLEGWFCYAAAGVAGLVFTRWGAIAMLEPWRRRAAWSESLGLLVKIALFAGGAWLVFNLLIGSSGCHGPIPFRLR